MDVRRLAAIDMHGLFGTRRRQRVIMAEFMLGAVVMVGAGVAIIAGRSTLATGVFGGWLVGSGLNYVPLAAHAIILNRPGALERELADVDVRAELRHYTLLQLWIFVPIALPAFEMTRKRAAARPG